MPRALQYEQQEDAGIMPLYRVVFEEQGGSRVVCRIRAALDANHMTLAVQKIWGAACYWSWVPGSDTEGRVYERLGDPDAPEDRARTGPTTVEIAPAQRRPRVPYSVIRET